MEQVSTGRQGDGTSPVGSCWDSSLRLPRVHRVSRASEVLLVNPLDGCRPNVRSDLALALFLGTATIAASNRKTESEKGPLQT